MKKLTVSEDSNSDRLQLFFHLIPIIGFFPSLWTLYQAEGDRRQETGDRREAEEQGIQSEKILLASSPTPQFQKEKLAISRLSVALALSWLLAYFLLSAGAETNEFFNFRLLMLNSLLTSGYFLVSLWLMLRLTTGKSVRLPGFSALADRAIANRKTEG